MTYNVLMMTLNPTHSHSLTHSKNIAETLAADTKSF